MLELEQVQKSLTFLQQKFWQILSSNLKLLAWKGKKKRDEIIIFSIQDKKGKIHTSNTDILKEISQYYKLLYTLDDPSKGGSQFFLLNILILNI